MSKASPEMKDQDRARTTDIFSLSPTNIQDGETEPTSLQSQPSKKAENKKISFFSLFGTNEVQSTSASQVQQTNNQQPNQHKKGFNLFGFFNSSDQKNNKNHGNNPIKETKPQTKNLFINQKPDNWPQWGKPQQPKPQQRQKERAKDVVDQNVLQFKELQKIPKTAAISRQNCLYYDYYHDPCGYTEFYGKRSKDFYGYKQIFEKITSKKDLIANGSAVCRVPTDIAIQNLQQAKKAGTYEQYKDWYANKVLRPSY